jgi:hypothetical protein
MLKKFFLFGILKTGGFKYMPEEDERTGIKLKIFLAAFLVMICVILGVYSYNFIKLNREYVNEETSVSNNCINLNFEIISAKYEGDALSVLVKNQPSSIHISKISIKAENITLSKETDMPALSDKTILFENFMTDKPNATMPTILMIFPNNCESYAKTVYLQNKIQKK